MGENIDIIFDFHGAIGLSGGTLGNHQLAASRTAHGPGVLDTTGAAGNPGTMLARCNGAEALFALGESHLNKTTALAAPCANAKINSSSTALRRRRMNLHRSAAPRGGQNVLHLHGSAAASVSPPLTSCLRTAMLPPSQGVMTTEVIALWLRPKGAQCRSHPFPLPAYRWALMDCEHGCSSG